DVGSNAMRLGIAVRDNDGLPNIILRHREPVRLGHDAFTSGTLSEATQNEALTAFHQFRRILDQHHVETLRGTATSAMRDSSNGRELALRIAEETGIKLDIISGEEEARLVQYSIAHRVDLNDHFALLIDIGGGSVEVTLCDDGEIIAAQSFKIGTVRLLEMLGETNDFKLLLSEYLDGARKKLREQIGSRQADLCVGTGGNALAIGELACQLGLSNSSACISHKQLGQLIEQLSGISIEERIRDLGLRPDRADVILPAAMVFHEIMALAGAETLHIPDASLLDGILLDMAASEKHQLRSRRRNLLGWAKSLKKKYHVDQHYAKAVTRLALSLFDQTRELHGLGNSERLLLEIAARVHEIGMYVRVGGHHRHAAYLIMAAPLLGISDEEKAVLAQTTRYQRKAYPDDGHEGFATLDEKDQDRVWKLSALLRLAIALNKDRRDRIETVYVDLNKDVLNLHLEGSGDLLLERWAALKIANFIEAALKRSLHIDLNID
ncbi:MAG: Ppx/GppA phosphatase family protein, partial [Mariprofundaceae bacterium]|nr:Ppx/GppA phosphatase family protein [Mariprofundaceae bacterium]